MPNAVTLVPCLPQPSLLHSTCTQPLSKGSHLLLAQDALQVDLFEEGEDGQARAALILVQVGQHARPLGACRRQDAAGHSGCQRLVQVILANHLHIQG